MRPLVSDQELRDGSFVVREYEPIDPRETDFVRTLRFTDTIWTHAHATLIFTMLHKARAQLAGLQLLGRSGGGGTYAYAVAFGKAYTRSLALVRWWETRWSLVPPRLAMRVARGV